MIRPVDFAGRLIFTVDFKGQVSIGQAWAKTQTKTKPNARPASFQQAKRKVTLYSSAKTGGVHSCSTRQKVSYHKGIMKDTGLRDWQYVTFYITQKGYDEDPLRCLGPKEAKMMIKEVH